MMRCVKWIIAALLMGGCFSGCATSSDPDVESDMPWNMPQAWESAPSLPGMDGGM